MTKNERHRAEQKARDQFQRKLEQLRFELRVGSPRRVLDYLVEHAEDLLTRVGDNLLVQQFRTDLDMCRSLVAQRHNLKLVRHAERHAHALRVMRETADIIERSAHLAPPPEAS